MSEDGPLSPNNGEVATSHIISLRDDAARMHVTTRWVASRLGPLMWKVFRGHQLLSGGPHDMLFPIQLYTEL